MKKFSHSLLSLILVAALLLGLLPAAHAAGGTLSVSGLNAPGNHSRGNIFHIQGTLKVSGCEIQQIRGYFTKADSQAILSGLETPWYNVNSRSYNLYNSQVDKSLYFGKLPEGRYQYCIEVKTTAECSYQGSISNIQVIRSAVFTVYSGAAAAGAAAAQAAVPQDEDDGCIPGTNLAPMSKEELNQQVIVEVIKDGAPLRNKASAKGSIIVKYNVGDCLRVLESKVNSSGNLWFRIQYPGETKSCWIYSGNVKAHTHSYSQADNSGFSLCRCGYFKVDQTTKNGIQRTSALAAAGDILNPDTMYNLGEFLRSSKAVAGELLAGAAGIAGYALSGYGVIVVLVVGSAILLVSLNDTATKAEVSSVVKGMNEWGKNALDQGVYYYASASNGSFFINPSIQLTIDEANVYLLSKAHKTNTAIMNCSINGIYTPNMDDARKLAERFALNKEDTKVFDYGDSKGLKTFDFDKDANGNRIPGHFDHYHIAYGSQLLFDFSAKKLNVHIWYGNPAMVQSIGSGAVCA